MSRIKSNVRLLDQTISVKWLKFSNSHHFHSSFLSLSCLLPNPVTGTALQSQNLIGKVHPNIINTPQQRIHFHILLRVIDSISQLQPPSPPAVIVINLATFFWAGKKSWRRSMNLLLQLVGMLSLQQEVCLPCHELQSHASALALQSSLPTSW